ncbi:MAG: hypothetical protein ACYC6X_03905 [Minisyncoccota bacterium]
MSRTSTLILIGILVILVPFSAFPISFRTFLAVILGACVSGIGLATRAQEIREMRSRTRTETSSPTASAMASESVKLPSESHPQEPPSISPI